mgnify:CR=1 FL=1
MTTPGSVLPLLVFEAADCLMAVPASEIAHLEKRGRESFSPEPVEKDSRPHCSIPSFDLDEYFTQQRSHGPWLRWGRGKRSAWLRVRRVVDVVPFAVDALTPMPALLSARQRTRAFLAAGVRGEDVFLLLDPARLCADRVGEAGP